jgi:hypothetical protein
MAKNENPIPGKSRAGPPNSWAEQLRFFLFQGITEHEDGFAERLFFNRLGVCKEWALMNVKFSALYIS